MEQRKFGRATAEGIRTRLAEPECLEVRDDEGGLGLYVADDYKDEMTGMRDLPSRKAGVAVLDWVPAEDMDWLGAPNPKEAPALPIPFTPPELTAFLLDGIGRTVEEVTESRIGSPLHPDAFGDFHPDDRWVAEALESAYALAIEAQAIVGAYDFERQRYAYRFERLAHKKERRARSRDATAHAAALQCRERGRSMMKAVDAAWVAWRKAMVRQLLMPIVETNTPSEPDRYVGEVGAWQVFRPGHFQGYGEALYEFLMEAKAAGRPKPNARDVLDAFKRKMPSCVHSVQSDDFTYSSGKKNRSADLNAISEAIGRMTRGRKDHE